ncbi:MAG: hypothetical protein GWP33_08870 [Alphaproteobacteria bacterium]|nr:hypothetical protein [Alphaproteobacteria bacterium]
MGNNLSVKTDDVLTASMVARLYATMDWALPKNGLDLGAPSPLNSYLILCLDIIKNDQLRPDGLAYEDEALPFIDLPRRVWGGGSLKFINPLRIGDKVSRATKIVDQKNKSGSLGEMIFVDLINDYYVDGLHCLSEELTLIYLPERLESEEVAEKSIVPRPEYDYAQSVSFSPHQLFRFSAITFNSHRIHFDPRHAQKVEAYPDQVVHGPIQTSIVLNCWQSHNPGKILKQIKLRCNGSAMVNETLHVQGVRHEDGDVLAVYNDMGEELYTAQVVEAN